MTNKIILYILIACVVLCSMAAFITGFTFLMLSGTVNNVIGAVILAATTFCVFLLERKLS